METITEGEINYGRCWGEVVFYLPHSCDEWVIGDLAKAEKFAQDLLKVIEKVKAL